MALLLATSVFLLVASKQDASVTSMSIVEVGSNSNASSSLTAKDATLTSSTSSNSATAYKTNGQLDIQKLPDRPISFYLVPASELDAYTKNQAPESELLIPEGLARDGAIGEQMDTIARDLPQMANETPAKGLASEPATKEQTGGQAQQKSRKHQNVRADYEGPNEPRILKAWGLGSGGAKLG